jgi:hypothetical protein
MRIVGLDFSRKYQRFVFNAYLMCICWAVVNFVVLMTDEVGHPFCFG